MVQEGQHWRIAHPLSHSGAEILPDGKDIEYIVIDRIEYKVGEEINGKKSQKAEVICHFKPNPYTNKPIVLNVTNCTTLTKLNGGDNKLNLIKDFPIRLTRAMTRDVRSGENIWGLRISKTPAKKPEPPKKKPLTPNDKEKMEKALDYLKNGGSMDKIKESYELNKATEEWMLGEIKE